MGGLSCRASKARPSIEELGLCSDTVGVLSLLLDDLMSSAVTWGPFRACQCRVMQGEARAEDRR